LVLVYDESRPGQADEAVFIQESLKEYDLEVNLANVPGWNPNQDRTGAWDLALMDWAPTNANPADVLGGLIAYAPPARINPARFHSEEALRLLAAAQGMTDTRRRAGLYYQVVEILGRDAPYLFLYREKWRAAYSPRIKGLALHPLYPQVLPLDRMELGPAPDYTAPGPPTSPEPQPGPPPAPDPVAPSEPGSTTGPDKATDPEAPAAPDPALETPPALIPGTPPPSGVKGSPSEPAANLPAALPVLPPKPPSAGVSP
jgi:hypothetical protein